MQVPITSTRPDKVTIINPDGTVSYEPNVHYQQPTIIRRTYHRAPKPKYRYMIEQVRQGDRRCSPSWIRVFFSVGRKILSMLSVVSILVFAQMSDLWLLWSHRGLSLALFDLVCSIPTAATGCPVDPVRSASEWEWFFPWFQSFFVTAVSRRYQSGPSLLWCHFDLIYREQHQVYLWSRSAV